VKTSESLVVGDIYTRNELRRMFDIRDATINIPVLFPSLES
jgi:hypothetical protein